MPFFMHVSEIAHACWHFPLYWCSWCIYFTPSVFPDHSRWCPPPQWLNPISCIWLGHWCRTKLWHCTSQSKLWRLSLLSLQPFYLSMFAHGLFPNPIFHHRVPQFQTVNTNQWLCFMRPMCSVPSLALQLHPRRWLEIRGTSREWRQAGLWPWELWAKEDGAQQERSILI